MNKKLSIYQAYCVMIDYLDKYYFKVYADDIGDLLGGMVFLEDGSTADGAAWEDWIEAIDKVKPSHDVHNNKDILLTVDEAYIVATNFLENFAQLTNSEDTRKLLDEKMLLRDGNPVDRENWDEWMRSVDKILAQNPLILPPFTLLN